MYKSSSLNTHVPLGAGAVIHTHSKTAVMATLLYPGKEFKISHQEMIKGISRGQMGKKYCYHDELVVPIIENTPEERDLTVSNSVSCGNYVKPTIICAYKF